MSGATFAPNCRRPRPLTYAVFNIFIVMALVTTEQKWGRKSVVAKYLKLCENIFRFISSPKSRKYPMVLDNRDRCRLFCTKCFVL